jgi:hypothetical protein
LSTPFRAKPLGQYRQPHLWLDEPDRDLRPEFALTQNLASPAFDLGRHHTDLIAAFIEEYRKAFNAATGDRSTAQTKAKRELTQMEKKIAGIPRAIEDGMCHPPMKAMMAAPESRKTRPTTFLQHTPI